MKKVISLFIISVFILHQIALAQITKRPMPRTTAPVSKYNPDKTEQLTADDTANDFADKGLPEPRDFGGEPNQGFAAAAAKKLSNYEEDNLPLLITTLQRAGFYIINDKQKILYQPTNGKGMGLAFYDYEVAGMYKLSRRGIVTSVEKMAAQIGKNSPELPPSQVASLMIQDLRRAVNSKNKLVRFWATLIIELGKNSPQKVDLLSENAANAPISIIQASLWERRLLGDMIAFAEKNLAALPRLQPQKSNHFFINASFNNFPQGPCQTSDVEGLVMDGASLGLTTANGFFMEKLGNILSEKGQAALGKISNGLFVVNLVLGWAKLIAALTSVRAEMKIAEPMPLVRTKNANQGETRLMTARFWTEVGNKSAINCARLAINTATGLDFSMPNDGPLSNKDVSWELTGASSFSGQGSSKTGRFDRFVVLEATEGSSSRNPMDQTTNDNGESQMNIVGAPKIPTVINQPVVPVRKKATVKVAVSQKGKRELAQNFLDLGGAVIGTLISGPLGILGSLPEIGFRMKFDVKSLDVPVKDWELCTADWQGTVIYRRVFKTSFAVNSGGRKGTRRIDENTLMIFKLNARPKDAPPNTLPIPADVDISIHNIDVFEGTGEADVCCEDKEAKDASAKIRSAKEFKFKGATQANVNINLSPNFLLSIYPRFLDYGSLRGVERTSFTVSSSACPVDEDKPAEVEREQFVNLLIGELVNTKTNRQLTKAPLGGEVEELTGTETYDDPKGGTITYEWSLGRCGN